MIDIERRQRHLRPVRDQRHIRKSLGAGKRGAWIHHRHVVVQRAGQRHQRLEKLPGADDDKLGGRRIDIEKQLLAAGLDHAALAHAQLFCQIGAERIGGNIPGLHQPLLAIGGIGDHDHRPPCGALDIGLCKRVELHDYPTFSTNTLIVPPQDRPTFHAVSSATPNSSILGWPLAITSSASVTTAPSTQPPDTEPRKVPSSLMTRLEPAGRGAEPQVSTTVASATPCPAFCQSSAAFRISSSRLSMGASFKLRGGSGCGGANWMPTKVLRPVPRSNSNYAPGGIRQHAAASF